MEIKTQVAALVGETIYFVEHRNIYTAVVRNILILIKENETLTSYDVHKPNEPIGNGASFRTLSADNVFKTPEAAKQYIIDTIAIENGN